MNANHLRRQLRTGGWDRHARNLAGFLVEHGLRSERTESGRTLRFQPAPDGGLVAYLQTREGWVPVADEHAVLLTREDADRRHPHAEREPSTVHLGVRLDPADADRLDRAARAAGKSKSHLARVAIRAYLQQRGL